MLTLACPSCGAAEAFRSKASVFAVCSFCKSTLVRQDMDLSAVGKMSELQDDMTPLQIGCQGTYAGKRFELIGRLKVGYSDGFWNEWYALFADGSPGWLAEAQGFYAMCFEVATREIPSSNALTPGTNVRLTAQSVFQVEDIRQVKCLYSEGELPLFATQGRESTSVDLTGPDNGMATTLTLYRIQNNCLVLNNVTEFVITS